MTKIQVFNHISIYFIFKVISDKYMSRFMNVGNSFNLYTYTYGDKLFKHLKTACISV